MTICLIAAMAANRTIGKYNKLPWYYPEDFAYFKKTTIGHLIIMGRRTYESIGRALPHRRNIVISSQTLDIPGVEIFPSIESCLSNLKKTLVSDEKVFVIGGASLYQQFLDQDLVDEIYLTKIHEVYEGDTFFPVFEENFSERERQKTEHMDFCLYTKKNTQLPSSGNKD